MVVQSEKWRSDIFLAHERKIGHEQIAVVIAPNEPLSSQESPLQNFDVVGDILLGVIVGSNDIGSFVSGHGDGWRNSRYALGNVRTV